MRANDGPTTTTVTGGTSSSRSRKANFRAAGHGLSAVQNNAVRFLTMQRCTVARFSYTATTPTPTRVPFSYTIDFP